MSQSKKQYLNYIHYFRGFAILVIVGIHCRISLNWGDNALGKQVFTTALDNGTILFVFIAGFLFQYLKEKFEYRSYLIRKIRFVVLPYLIISALPIILKMLELHHSSWIPPDMIPDNPFLKGLFYITTGKHLGPFWFIPMIVIFYIISPLFIKIDKPWFYKWVFPPLMVASLFTFKFGFFSNVWASFIHFFPVYIFGMWAANNKDRLTGMPINTLVVLIVIYLGLSVIEIAGLLPAPRVGSFEEDELMPFFAFNIVKLRVYLLCLILFKVFYLFDDKQLPLLRFLGDYSFGIYFIHIFIIKAIQWIVLYIDPDFTLNFVTFLIYVGLVSVVTIFVVKVTKTIFGDKSRMIIGS